MRNTTTTRAAAVAALLVAVALTGCSSDTAAGGPGTRDTASSSPAPVPAEAKPLLARYDLEGMDTVAVIDHLDRLGGEERPSDLMASVRPEALVVSSADEEFSLEVPEDRFYLSVAPYVDQTHECFYHSLTTCKGELDSRDVSVEIVDETNDEVLVDGSLTTFENGFVGFWLPRDIEGTLKVTYDGKTAEMDFATDAEAPTCVTTLQLT